MKRVASHFIVCSPHDIRRNAVVELDDNGVLTQVFDLNDSHVEAAHTLFYDGVISATVMSMGFHFEADMILEMTDNFHFIDFTKEIPTKEILPNGKPLLIDFGTENPSEINSLLSKLSPYVTAFTVFDLVSACVSYPALLLDHSAPLQAGKFTPLIIWQDVDLVNKKITEKTKVSFL